MAYDVVILFSGGADSIYCSQVAEQSGLKPFYLMIDYEQKHIEELNKAKKYLNHIKQIQHSQTVSIKNLHLDSGLTNNKPLLYVDEHEMYVPGRNMMFVSIAASIAENKNINKIWYGADLSDYENNFSDCKQEWIIKVNQLLEINGSYPIKLECPTLGLSKEMIEDMLINNMGKENYEEFSFSGYGDL